MATKIDGNKLYHGDCFISHKVTLMFSTTSSIGFILLSLDSKVAALGIAARKIEFRSNLQPNKIFFTTKINYLFEIIFRKVFNERTFLIT